MMLDAKAAAYRRLLGDPCHGPFAAPPVSGPSSGLFVRQRYYLQPSAPSGANATSAFLRLTPATGQAIWGYFGQVAQQTLALETGILTSARSYRCVAACAKWIPTGALANRKGFVTCGYVADSVAGTGSIDADYLNGLRGLCSTTYQNAGTGKEMECLWLPSGPEDLEFKDKSLTYSSDTGTTLFVLNDIDCAAKTTDNSMNGFFEITCVWEWLPEYSAGVVAPVQAPSANTLQQVLATLGDLSSFVTSSPFMQKAGRVASMFLAQRAVDYVAGPSFPRVTY
jgi:hypothetical protein